jgi:ubiquinone/menaquinone biosynthesis C-methylase UbiE
MLGDLWWRLVRFGFRLLYYELAFTYDAVSWIVSLGQWRCWQRSSLEFLDNASDSFILELAHGTGNLQLDLHQANYQTIPFDLSPNMGRIAKSKLARHDINQDFVRGSAFQLPFADSTFTDIISTFPTNFIAQPDTLSEVHRILQNDGQLIVVLNGILTGGGVVRSFLEWLYRITGQRHDTQENDIRRLFIGYGFIVETHQVVCSRSLAQLVILRKTIDENSNLL